MSPDSDSQAPDDSDASSPEPPPAGSAILRILKRVGRLLMLGSAVIVAIVVVLAIAIEVLMAINARVIGETDFSLRSDWESGAAELDLQLPGATPIPELEAPPASDTVAWRQWLVDRHAPVLVQRLGHHPEWDLPVAIDFDGNEDPRDNPDNARREYPTEAAAYGELTAITEDSYYLTYTFYRLRDYDHPVREIIVRTSHHDGDNEGFHLRVDRETLEVTAAETWFHNRFVLCDLTGESTGTDPVHGKLHFEGTHPIIYGQDLGHGVRCAQTGDSIDLARSKVFRPALGRELTPLTPDGEPEHDLSYRLLDFDRWYERAANDPVSDSATFFVGRILLSPEDDPDSLHAVQYIAGRDRDDISHWSRPKPMWAWDDIWDGIPVAAWHFLPSYSFATRSGLELSHDYEFNRPAERLYGMSGNELGDRISWDPGSGASRIRNEDTERSKWTNFDPGLVEVERKHYWWAAEQLVEDASAAIRRLFNRYAMRVFTRLG